MKLLLNFVYSYMIYGIIVKISVNKF